MTVEEKDTFFKQTMTIQTEGSINSLKILKKGLMTQTKPTKQMEFTGHLFNYKEFRKYSDTFIETGNAAGDGLQRALDAGFTQILGIEAQEMYYNMCIERFKAKPRLALFYGTSIDRLPELSKNFNSRPVIFYLDAHVSGDTSFGYEDWIKNGEESEAAQDKTIKAELEIILSNYNKHVICIDDVNGLTDGHAAQYMDLILRYNPNYKFQFYDENLGGPKETYYKDKILVAIPN